MSIVTPRTEGPAIPASELERYGIVRVATERFEVGGYRYERLADAVAEARRQGAGAASRDGA